MRCCRLRWCAQVGGRDCAKVLLQECSLLMPCAPLLPPFIPLLLRCSSPRGADGALEQIVEGPEFTIHQPEEVLQVRGVLA